MKFLFALLLTPFLILASTQHAEARRSAGPFSYGEKLLYVQDLQSDAPEFRNLSLCKLADFHNNLFIPTTLEAKSYVLSKQRCEDESYFPLADEDFLELRQLGAVSPALPDQPKLTRSEFLKGHAGFPLLLLSFFLSIVMWNHKKGFLPSKKSRTSRTSEALVVNVLDAMSAVAVSDGEIDDREVNLITGIVSDLSGRAIPQQTVRDMLENTLRHGPDLTELGKGLKHDDKNIVLGAAMATVVADGKIEPAEHQILTQIATRLSIGRDEFMAALTQAQRSVRTA